MIVYCVFPCDDAAVGAIYCETLQEAREHARDYATEDIACGSKSSRCALPVKHWSLIASTMNILRVTRKTCMTTSLAIQPLSGMSHRTVSG